MYRQKARQRATFWRLVFSGHFSYEEVASMDWDEFNEAVAALELYREIMPQPKVPKLPKPKRR